jgi:hypothetical protein
MTRTRAGKALDAIDRKIAVLEHQRRELERQAFGQPVNDGERRARYFSLADVGQRRRLIGLERRLHQLRREQRDAAVTYWRIMVAETRAKLADLGSEALSSNWKRGILWDIVTVFWIFVGLGWLTYRWAGAAVGAIVAAVGSRYIARSRERSRMTFLRQGNDVLRSNESELQQAEREAALHEGAPPAFSATEEQTGIEDAPGTAMMAAK